MAASAAWCHTKVQSQLSPQCSMTMPLGPNLGVEGWDGFPHRVGLDLHSPGSAASNSLCTEENASCQRAQADCKAARIIHSIPAPRCHLTLLTEPVEELEGLDCRLKALTQLFSRHSLRLTVLGQCWLPGLQGPVRVAKKGAKG